MEPSTHMAWPSAVLYTRTDRRTGPESRPVVQGVIDYAERGCQSLEAHLVQLQVERAMLEKSTATLLCRRPACIHAPEGPQPGATRTANQAANRPIPGGSGPWFPGEAVRRCSRARLELPPLWPNARPLWRPGCADHRCCYGSGRIPQRQRPWRGQLRWPKMYRLVGRLRKCWFHLQRDFEALMDDSDH